MANKHNEELRKKKRKHERNSPFPVPIASLTGLSCDENYWYHFTGQLQNDSVLVTSSGDIRCLDRMGFFGRGLLSRGGPDFHKSMPHVYFASEVGGDPDIVSVMKRRMYLRHKHWQQLDKDPYMDQDQIAGEDLEFDSDIEYEEYQDERQCQYDRTVNNLTTTGNKDSVMCSNNEQAAANNSRLKDDTVLRSWDNAEGDADFWSSETKLIDGKSGKNDIVKKDNSTHNSWDDTEGDSEFWTSETNEKQTASNTSLSKNDKVSMSWDNIEADADFWNSEASDKESGKHRLSSNDNGTDNSWENTQGDSTFLATDTTERNGEQDGNVVTEQGDNTKSNCDKDDKTKTRLDTGNVQVGSDWDNSMADEDFWGIPVDSKASINATDQPPSKKRKMEDNSSTCDTKNRDHVTKNIDQVTENNCHVTETDDRGNVATNLSSSEVLTGKADQNQINKNFDDLSHMNVKENLNAVQNVIKDSVNRTTNIETSQKLCDNYCSTEENITGNKAEDKNVMQTERNNESDSNSDNNMQSSIDKHQKETKELNEKSEGETDKELNSDMPDLCDERKEVDKADLHSNCGNDKLRTDNTDNAGVQGHINEGEEVEKLETDYELNSDMAEVCDEAEENEKVDLHPDCDKDDPDADYLVIDDVDEGHKFRRRHDWQPVMKKDPFPYTEPLVLAAEEAFFLSYGLGCLTVLNEDSKTSLTLKELWLTFCKQPRFLPCYAAYHYLRSKGWVPKSGIIFGTDFILYKEGPPFYHASYSIVVKAVYSGTYKPVEEYSNRSLTWTSFSGLHRVTEHVVKTLLICYVIIPPDLTEEEKSSPNCLSRLKIHLQKYNRWVSSEEREQGKVTRDMP